MSNIEKAVSFMIDIAKDDSHGYDQIHRTGDRKSTRLNSSHSH